MHCLTRAQKHVFVLSVSPENKTGTKRSHRITDFSSKQEWIFKLKHSKTIQISTISPQVFKQGLVAR